MKKSLVVAMMLAGAVAFAQEENPWRNGRDWFVAALVGVSQLDSDGYGDDPFEIDSNWHFEGVDRRLYAAQVGLRYRFK